MNPEALRLARMLRRNAERVMADALAHPLLAQGLEHVCGATTINDFRRVLYEPFERARGANPFLTMREFIGSGPPERRAMMETLFGKDGVALMVEHSGPDYFATRTRVLKGATTPDGPLPQWLGWGHWGRDAITISTEGRPRLLLPIDFPVQGRYPDFNTVRMRLICNLAYIELNVRLGGRVDIPVGGGSPALLKALNLPYDPNPRLTRSLGFSLTDLQVAKLYATGEMPAFQTRIMPSGSEAPPGFVRSENKGGRGAVDARWELASRLKDYDLVLSAQFQKKIRNYPEAASTVVPPTLNPGHPITTLTNAQLVAIAQRDVGCLEIMTQTYQVSHKRAQRAIGQIEDVIEALDGIAETSLIAHLCGLGDPRNLTILSPTRHGTVDFFAYYVQNRGVWVPNTVRASGPPIPFEEHEGFAAAVNVFEDFSPYHLTQVASMLTEPEVMKAVENAPSTAVEAYNHLAGSITAIMHAYEMKPSRFPMRFSNGEWK